MALKSTQFEIMIFTKHKTKETNLKSLNCRHFVLVKCGYWHHEYISKTLLVLVSAILLQSSIGIGNAFFQYS